MEYSFVMANDYSIREVAQRVGLSKEMVRRHCVNGLFPGAYRRSPVPGSPWRIPESAVNNFLERRRKAQI